MKIGDLVTLTPNHAFHDIGVGVVLNTFTFSTHPGSPEYCTVLFPTGEKFSPLMVDLVLVQSSSTSI